MKRNQPDVFSEQQLKQIRQVFNEGINELVIPRFDEVDKRFEEVDKKFDSIDNRFDQSDAKHRHTHARLDIIENDVSLIKDGHNRLFKQVQRIDDNQAKLIDEVKEIRRLFTKMVSREEFETLSDRILKVEKHLGLV